MRSLFNSLTHLHHPFGAGPDGLERPEGVSEGEPRLRLRPALHQLHRAGHQADLAGEVYDPVHLKAGNKFITCRSRESVRVAAGTSLSTRPSPLLSIPSHEVSHPFVLGRPSMAESD